MFSFGNSYENLPKAHVVVKWSHGSGPGDPVKLLPSLCVQTVKGTMASERSMLSRQDDSTMSLQHEALDSKRDFAEDGTSVHSVVGGIDLVPREDVRPPIVYSSPKAFTRSLWLRWKSVWTRRFMLSLLAGQVVSLCITVTNVTTTELVSRNWSLPTTQTWFLYVSCVNVIAIA